MQCSLFIVLLLTSPASARSPKPNAVVDAAPATPIPRFSRTEVPGCGCGLYAPQGFSIDAPTKSADGADVWTSEGAVGAWHFGAVVVKFAEPALGSGSELEDLLVGYLDFLKGQLSITKSAGVGRGHTHSENPAAVGVIDYWEDKAGDSWAVKGWVDANRLAVMFVYGRGEYPYLAAQSAYLDGFRFQ